MAKQDANVVELGAKGDGVSDDTKVIQEALNSGAGSVHLPAGNYVITATLRIPAKVTLRGTGRLSRLLKAFNGDMVEMLDSSKLNEIELEGQGAKYAGRGVVIRTGSNQKVLDCAIVNMKGYCVEYVGASAGTISVIDKSMLYTADKAKLPAIKYPDSENIGDRKLTSVDANGGLLADFAGSSTTMVSDCDTIGVLFDKSSKKVALVGNRIAGGAIGYSLELYGSNHAIVGNLVATPIYLKAGLSNSVVMSNVSGGLVDESDTQTNLTDTNSKGFVLSGNYGGINPHAAYMSVGAGGKSPNAGSISFGDGTGWRLNIGTNRGGSFVPLFGFYDKGCMYLPPIAASDSRNGTLFVDAADQKLKYKGSDGKVNSLY